MAACVHLVEIQAHPPVAPHPENGCEDCLAVGDQWVHLRLCLTCGKVGCCDSSPNKHASAHARGDRHPVIRSYEPGEAWRWCLVDDAVV